MKPIFFSNFLKMTSTLYMHDFVSWQKRSAFQKLCTVMEMLPALEVVSVHFSICCCL